MQLLTKSWNDKKKNIFHVPWLEIIKDLAEKSFSALNGPPPNTNKHTKIFFWPNFLLFFLIMNIKKNSSSSLNFFLTKSSLFFQ